MSFVSVTVRGVDAVERYYRNQAINLRGGPKTLETYMANPSRNKVIQEAQANQDRNPFYLNTPERRQVTQWFARALSDSLRTRTRGAWEARLAWVAGQLTTIYRDHIQRRKSGGVPPLGLASSGHQTRALTPDYAARKQKEWGRKVPELIASGQFFNAIHTRVVK